jgi:two-component system, cell cycle sensor histidine kinase and response regulator CckA
MRLEKSCGANVPDHADLGEHYRSLFFEQVSDGLFLCDGSGIIKEVNGVGCARIGRTPDDLRGRALREIVAPAEQAKVAGFLHDLAQRGACLWETLLARPDGSTLPVEVSAQLMQDGDQTLLLAAARDLSERRRAEAERQDVAARAIRAERLESVGLLSRKLIHEFANVLSAIQGNAETGRFLLPVNDPACQAFDNILVSVAAATDLMRFMRRYVGSRPGGCQPVSINAVVEEVMRVVDRAMVRVELAVELAPDLPVVLGDPAEIGQIVVNLLINAIDAITGRPGRIQIRSAGGPVEKARLGQSVLLEVPPEGDYVELTVADNGCGMSAEVQRRMFEPFFSTKPGGTGLGLSSVLAVMRSLGGAVLVDSLPQAGTTFTLLFPAARQAAGPDERPTMDAWRADGLVAVVDDDRNVRLLAEAYLAKWGLRAVPFAGGEEALAYMREHAKTLAAVLLDLAMPTLHGFEVLAQLRAIDPDVPVIICSGYEPQQARELMGAHAPAGYLQKPFSSEELARTLREVIIPGPGA